MSLMNDDVPPSWSLLPMLEAHLDDYLAVRW
jgi:hypothetical protein